MGDGKSSTKPLIVGLENPVLRTKILKISRKLADTRFKDVNIIPDLTKQQRQEDEEVRKHCDKKKRGASWRGPKLHVEGSWTKRPRKSHKSPHKLQSCTAGQKWKETEHSKVHQSENQRQDPEREEGEGGGGGGYNKNGGAEPYLERETLSILYLNAQSIISKLNELQVVSKDLHPSIILVTESWCNNSIYDSTISIQGYELSSEIRKDRHDTRN